MTLKFFTITKKLFYILLLIIILFCSTFFIACDDTSEVLPEIVIDNDFRTEGIWGTGIYEFNNVVTDPEFDTGDGGHEDWGVVTGGKWGAYVSAGDGYLTYEIQADNGLALDVLTLDFSAFLGHKGIVPYIGADKTNLTVSCSYDNVTFEKVYSLYETIEKIDDGKIYDRTINLSDYSQNKSIIYVRLDLIHLSYDEFPASWRESSIFNANHYIVLQKLGLKLFNVKLTATQKNI